MHLNFDWRLTIIIWGWHASQFWLEADNHSVRLTHLSLIWRLTYISIWTGGWHIYLWTGGWQSFCEADHLNLNWLQSVPKPSDCLKLAWSQSWICLKPNNFYQTLVNSMASLTDPIQDWWKLSFTWSIWTLWLCSDQWNHLSWWCPWATITITKFENVNFSRAIGAPAKTRYSGHSLSLLWESWWLLHPSV